MSTINVDPAYFDHPKTCSLILRLGRGAEVLPIRLWAYAAIHRADGVLAALDEAGIEERINWWGQKGEAVQALLDAGFLEKKGETFVIHDWMEHEGHILAYRERGRKGARAKWQKTVDSS